MPTLASSPATLALMIVTVAFSVLGFMNQGLWRATALEPHAMVRSGQYHQVVTAGLLHADFWHLLLNMMTLYFFGPILEYTVGGSTFLVIYLVSLVVGNVYPLIKFRNQPDYVAIGASGAVSGVLFSFCLFYPMVTISIWFVPMPAFVFAILYVGYSVFAMRNRRDNIGHEAHLAGAFAGLITTLILVPAAVDSVLGLLP